jgi:hypothetical protein
MAKLQPEFPADIVEIFVSAECPGPAGEESVVSAEREFNIEFPIEYRAFLLRHGAALFDGLEIYGLVRPLLPGELFLWTDWPSLSAQHPLGLLSFTVLTGTKFW